MTLNYTSYSSSSVRTMTCGPNLAHQFFLYIKLYWNTTMPICLHIVYGCSHTPSTEWNKSLPSHNYLLHLQKIIYQLNPLFQSPSMSIHNIFPILENQIDFLTILQTYHCHLRLLLNTLFMLLKLLNFLSFFKTQCRYQNLNEAFHNSHKHNGPLVLHSVLILHVCFCYSVNHHIALNSPIRVPYQPVRAVVCIFVLQISCRAPDLSKYSISA